LEVDISKSAKLTREQKEAVGLLSIGTFLEYFDLMLYVHMAVLLNELFFPKTDPFTASLISAFAFCSVFIFRPFGALIFGYIGDKIGRRHTVIITTLLMSCACLTMSMLPTYAEIGIAASVSFFICRIAQGMSSMGEIIGAELYLTEMIKKPLRYPVVSLIAVASSVGEMVALGVASLVTLSFFNWRAAFVLGAVIALVGAIARIRLRETPEFVNAKKRLLSIKSQTTENLEELTLAARETVKKSTALAVFLVNCAWAPCLYYTYIYCAEVLKNSFNYSPHDIILQNFFVALAQLITWSVLAYLSKTIYPLKIMKIRIAIFYPLVLFIPYLLHNASDGYHVFFIQLFIVIFGVGITPAAPIFFKNIPVFQRFTCYAFMYALSRALIYVITSFGTVYLTKWYGYQGILFIILPIGVGLVWAVNHFERMEIDSGSHPYKKNHESAQPAVV